ncbi:hypothetical protein [uncultured Methanobrevibacter sp.]|uniref:hypothetical protein n=1 Tax=uncultured Methanobrevibacter sp. TaxID=253161 RepID=UPI0025CE964F|nr:hypothetical protein [uncultured Methanobrevibacter sp.]
MLDNKGSFYIIDGILAILLLLVALLIVNSVFVYPNQEYSYETNDIRNAQDIMELLSGKIDFNDRTFIGDISEILKDGENSKESIDKVSKISKNKLDSYNLKNYKFCENNILKGEVLASSGNYNNAQNVSVAIRTYGDYSYSLYLW